MYLYSLPLAVDTAQTLEGISAQILQNKKDLPAAIAANQAAGAAGGNEGASAISGALIFHPSHFYRNELGTNTSFSSCP